MKDKIIMVFVATVFIMGLIFLSYGAFKLKRWLNWKTSYEYQVKKVMDEHINKYHNGEIK